MSVVNSDSIRAGAAGASAAYTIEQSCRFNDDDNASITVTGTTGETSDKIATISFWCKRGNLGADMRIFNCVAEEVIRFQSDDTLSIYLANQVGNQETTRVFRDCGAWYHFVIRWDTTNGTAGDRMRLYVNGIEETVFDVDTQPAQNTAFTKLHTAVTYRIGSSSAGANEFDGYLAEYVFIDGTSYGPDSFGEDDDQGNWIPKDPSTLTFGNKGWYKDFAVAPGTGNGAGTDVSGNAIHWADTGLAANDQVTDSPSDDAANNIGNYPTLNPLDITAGTLSDGNLRYAAGSYDGVRATQPCIDLCYFELYMEARSHVSDGARTGGGVCLRSVDLTVASVNDGAVANSWGLNNGWMVHSNGSQGTNYAGSWDPGEYACFALRQNGSDVDIWIGADSSSSWLGGGDPTTPATPTVTASGVDMGDLFVFIHGYISGDIMWINFGQKAFDNAVPTGFQRIHTANRAAPAVKDSTKFYQTDRYTGTGSELVRTLTDGGGAAFKPDFVHFKNFSSGTQNALYDSVRGATKLIYSDDTAAELTVAQALKSFDTSGYTLGTSTTVNDGTPHLFAAWCWNTQGGAGSSNEDGSINTTSTSVGTTQGFSISKYTGTGSAATVGHGLGVAPDLIWTKNLVDVDTWGVYHSANTAAPETDYLVLNTTAATADLNTYWNDTAPTTSVFSIGTITNTNGSSDAMVAYCWAGVEGFSKFDSYVGNGNASGPFIWLGFRPAFFLIKSVGVENWHQWDNKRVGASAVASYNVITHHHLPNTTPVPGTSGNEIDFLSNGVKFRGTNTGFNGSGTTYIYCAWAEAPFGGSGISQARGR